MRTDRCPLRAQFPVVVGDGGGQFLVHRVTKQGHYRPWTHQHPNLVDQAVIAVDKDRQATKLT